jgi:hypothetical protein
MLRRMIAATTTAAAALLFAVSMVTAGGWAEIQADAATTTEPPIAGEPMTVGFMVLQHGVTPAGWVTPTVVFRDTVTGRTVDADVAAKGADGHFVATVTLPTGGVWTWSVQLAELLVETPPWTVSVRMADGAAAPIDPAVMLQAVEQARQDVTRSVTDTMYAEVSRLDGELEALRGQTGRLQDELRSTAAALEAAEARAADGAGSTDGVPVLGIILLAVLAGATAGFAMAWLAGRPAPRQVETTLNPAPRGSTPA